MTSSKQSWSQLLFKHIDSNSIATILASSIAWFLHVKFIVPYLSSLIFIALIVIFFKNNHNKYFNLVVFFIIFTASSFAGSYGMIKNPTLNLVVITGISMAYLTTFWLNEKIYRVIEKKFQFPFDFRIIILSIFIFTLEISLTKINPFGSWTSFGYSLADINVINKSFGVWGVYGVSILLVIIAVSLANLSTQTKKISSSITLALAIIGLTAPYFILPNNALDSPISVSLIALNENLYSRENLNIDLLNYIEEEAKAGQKLIATAEGNFRVLESDLPTIKEKISQIAKENQNYIFAGFWVIPDNDLGKYTIPRTNKVLGFNSKGQEIVEYIKQEPVPGEFISPSENSIPVIDTDLGIIAVAICFDHDFPENFTDIKYGQVDILISPAREWKAINPKHSTVLKARALEIGSTQIKPTTIGRQQTVSTSGYTIEYQDNIFDKVRILRSEIK